MTTVYVKLGGSLLTDKQKEESPRHDVIRRLAQEIHAAWQEHPNLRLLVGHGSGSFGHFHARKYGTRNGVDTAEEWLGFARTADAANRLNRIVIEALLAEGLPAWSIQPSATLRCTDGDVVSGPEVTIALALRRGLVPVVFGDVALDSVRGGTIASTEEIFTWLAQTLPPDRIILAGEVAGLYTHDPLVHSAAALVPEVTRASLAALGEGVGASAGTDVTGGMAAKLALALNWVERESLQEVLLCSGLQPDNLRLALLGADEAAGTRVRYAPPAQE